MTMNSGAGVYCDFCGRNANEVFHLVAGPTAHICDECVELAGAVVTSARWNASRSCAPWFDPTHPLNTREEQPA